MKQLERKIRYVISFLVLFFVFLGVSPKGVEAKTPLPQWKWAEITDSDTVIDSKYTFIPKFSDNTKLYTSGGTWKNTTWSDRDLRRFHTFNIFEGQNHNKKGSMVARYYNVGQYNGRELDLKIIVKDWKIHNKQVNGGNISFEEKKIAVSTSGFDWVDMEWQFYDANTNKPVQVNGYFTISDVDLNQGIDLSPNTYGSVNKFYIANAKNQLWYNKVGGWHRISTDFSGDVPDTSFNDKYAFTFTFSQSALRFRWSVDWPKRSSSTKPNYKNKNRALGDYFFYTDVKPAPFDVEKPTKKVNLSNLRHPHDTNQELVYDVNFHMPTEAPGTYYSSVVLSDKLDSVLDVKNVKVYDNNTGADVSNHFNISTKGQQVEVSGKPSYLSWGPFYNRTYRVRIRASINKGSLDSIFSNRNVRNYNIPNIAKLTVNKRNRTTNKVNTSVAAPVYYRSTVNHIDIESGETITTSSREILEGEPYYETSLSGLKRGIYNYKSLHPKVQEGIMYKNMVINFYYRVPDLTIKNEGIHIYTDRKGSTQPVDVFLSSKIKDSGDSISDFAGGTVRLSVRDITNGRTEWSESKNINTIYSTNKYSFNLPNSFLRKGAKTRYRYDIEISHRGYNGYKLVTSRSTIDTHGYTASEEVLRNSEILGRAVSTSGVVLTEAGPSGEVAEYKEYVTVDALAQPRLKSGYGYEFEPRIRYRMDTHNNAVSRVNAKLPNRKTDPKPLMDLDERIVDLSDDYLNSYMSGGMVPIHMDVKNNQGTNKSAIRDMTYRLPRGYLSRIDGRIRYNYTTKSVDSGYKMYVPVWIKDLNRYDAILKSTVNIGSNQIGLEIDNEVDVYAFMLNHEESDTPYLDELLLHPMHKDDELFGW